VAYPIPGLILVFFNRSTAVFGTDEPPGRPGRGVEASKISRQLEAEPILVNAGAVNIAASDAGKYRDGKEATRRSGVAFSQCKLAARAIRFLPHKSPPT
jgi:hypothetical protein